MKKIKIMLLSLVLFAVIGGALAFKAKRGNRYYCLITTNLNIAGVTCPTMINNLTADPEADFWYYTTPYVFVVDEQVYTQCFTPQSITQYPTFNPVTIPATCAQSARLTLN